MDQGAFGEAALEHLLRATGGVARPVVGLATGNTPVGLYAALRARGDAAWIARVRPFAIDEYGGRGDHPCANRAYFASHWEAIPGAAAVEQFDPDAPDRAAECGRLAAALRAAGGLDLVVLGIGRNGHLAFNEPGSEAGSMAREVRLTEASMDAARGCWGDETPETGLTLGLAEILGARTALLLANGAAKAGIVARALEGASGPGCPASYLQRHPRAVVVLDTDAAALLRRGAGAIRRD
ncbi:MAG: 6-phosphogluconolactonase [Chloroflexi bacterium]|nr:6-phosphogluconolactonase [Chloroflexota bacterium]